jgi:hypothetical protein
MRRRGFGSMLPLVVRAVNWTRESEWDPVAKTAKPPVFKKVTIEAPPATNAYPSWAERQMKWLNDHLQSDPVHKYDPVP